MTPKTFKIYWLPALIHQICIMQEAWIMRKFDACTSIHLIAKSESDYDPQNLKKNIGLLLDTLKCILQEAWDHEGTIPK